MEQPQSVAEQRPRQDKHDMVFIPRGQFEMGSQHGSVFEQPVHSVVLEAYWIDAHLVTNQEFARFAAETNHRTTAEQCGSAWGYRDGRYGQIAGLSWRSYATPDRDKHPVVLVSWSDAAAYAAWRGKRLPTEAQWEKASRGGLLNALYPWGDREPSNADAPFGRAPLEVPPTAAVGSHPPNGYGLWDMVGNVWQWCADWYGADYYGSTPHDEPRGPALGGLRVRRGAAWNVIQSFRLRCANRGAALQEMAVPNTGFRCAISASP